MENQEDRFKELLYCINDVSDNDPISWYKKTERVCKDFSAKTHKKRGVQNRVAVIFKEYSRLGNRFTSYRLNRKPRCCRGGRVYLKTITSITGC